MVFNRASANKYDRGRNVGLLLEPAAGQSLPGGAWLASGPHNRWPRQQRTSLNGRFSAVDHADIASAAWRLPAVWLGQVIEQPSAAPEPWLRSAAECCVPVAEARRCVGYHQRLQARPLAAVRCRDGFRQPG